MPRLLCASTQSGASFTAPPLTAEPAELLGYSHIDFVLGDHDLLPDIGNGFGAQGFAGALPAGDYTFCIQETLTGTFDYRFDFHVTPVPLPSASLLFALSAAVCCRRLRRRRLFG